MMKNYHLTIVIISTAIVMRGAVPQHTSSENISLLMISANKVIFLGGTDLESFNGHRIF